MAQLSARPRVAQRSPLEIGVDRVWRFFCSVRAAVYEIVLLALLVLIGTLGNSSVPDGIADVLPFTAPLVREWYAWDVFHSLPFAAILTLLAVAITVCTINRAPAIWRAIANPTVPTSHGFLRGADPSARMVSTATPAAFGDDLIGVLKARRYRVLTERRGDEIHVYADKNRYAKLGTFPFHLALILILVGGIVGARFGFREQEVIVPEGSTRAIGNGTGLSIHVERFRDTYAESGVAQEYSSDIVLYNEDGEEVRRGTTTVNHPLTHDGVVIYQASFNQAVVLQITDAAGRVLFDEGLDLGIYQSKTNPDAPAGRLDLPMAGLQLNVIAPDNNRVNAPELDDLQLRPGEMYVKAIPTDPTKAVTAGIVRQGEAVDLGGLSVRFVRETQFSLLQVARNPGIPIFLLAAVLLVGGLAVTFYFPHRRVRGIVSPAPSGAVTALAPLAKRDWSGQRDFHRLLEEVANRLGIQPEVHASDESGFDRDGARPDGDQPMQPGRIRPAATASRARTR